MITIRRWHGYIGALIAPSVLFFAFSGTLQLFSLHESRAGYQAPAWIETLGNVHKDQVLKKAGRPGPPPSEGGDHDHGPPPAAKPDAAQIRSWVLKWEFALVALGLIASTLFGITIALRDPRRRRTTLILLAVGAAVPFVTIFV